MTMNMTMNPLERGRRRRAGIALLVSLALLHAQTALAWSNHALLTWPALSAEPAWAALPPVRVESLDTFLAAEATGLATLLRDEEAWAVQQVPNYPARPAPLAFRADAAATAAARRAAFIAAVRINPASRLNLFLQLPPAGSPGDRPVLKESDVTPLTSTEASKFDTFVALREGETVPVVDVIATATDEPDYGIDIGVWSDNGTAHGAAYGFGKQPFGNPALEFSSQAPLHIGYYHEAAIVYKAAPFLARTFPEARIHLWRSLAAYALRTGHDYWGWRFAGWALHYVQDLTQPYHARVLPGIGVTRMLWINTIDLIGVHDPKAHAITFVSNRHLALENFELHWMRSVLAAPPPGGGDALRALRDATQDAREPYRDDWPRERISQQSFEAADAIDAALVAALPARITSDPSYAYGVTETGLDLYATSTPQARETLMRAITPLLANAGRHTRAFARGLRPN